MAWKQTGPSIVIDMENWNRIVGGPVLEHYQEPTLPEALGVPAIRALTVAHEFGTICQSEVATMSRGKRSVNRTSRRVPMPGMMSV
jgi:hypothetical protein